MTMTAIRSMKVNVMFDMSVGELLARKWLEGKRDNVYLAILSKGAWIKHVFLPLYHSIPSREYEEYEPSLQLNRFYLTAYDPISRVARYEMRPYIMGQQRSDVPAVTWMSNSSDDHELDGLDDLIKVVTEDWSTRQVTQADAFDLVGQVLLHLRYI